MAAECSVPGCGRELVARGWCRPHWKRWKRRGTVHDITPEETFFARVTEDASGCWLWNRAMESGYGQFSDNRKMWLAHRWSYEFLRAEIPDGLVLDHLCRVRVCVNPWHLEPVTQSANIVRSYVTCRSGHAYTDENTEFHPTRGHRQCKQCRQARDSRAARLQLANVGG